MSLLSPLSPVPLYHFSPRDRLSSIAREGLQPGKRNLAGPTYHDFDNKALGEFLQPCVCFSMDPATAWAYSHEVWNTKGMFDLWQIWLRIEDVHKVRYEMGRIVEVRIFHHIDKDRLNWVGERTQDNPFNNVRALWEKPAKKRRR